MHTGRYPVDDAWKPWPRFAELAGRTDPGAFAPYLQAAERFAGAARRYLEDAAAAPGATSAAAAAAARSLSHFLRDQSAALSRPPWGGEPGARGESAAAADPLPALGPAREHQLRLQRTAEAAGRMADAQRRLLWLWLDTLRDAADAFAERVQPLAGAGLRQLYAAWIDCAEAAYSRTAHGDDYCIALADYINAASQWRAEMAAGIDQASKMLDLPSRNELETLTRRLESLERQWRAAREPPPVAARPAAPRAPRPRRAKRAPKS
jgi:hypothetical protein